MGFFNVGRGGNRDQGAEQGNVFDLDVLDGSIDDTSITNLGPISNTGKYGTIEVNVQSTDYGAIDSAFELADNSLMFAGGAMSRALDSSDAARNDALEFGAGAMVAAFEEAERSRQMAAQAQHAAMQQVRETQAEANAMVRENTAQSISAVRASTVDAMQFSAGAFQEAVSSIDESNEASLSSVIGFSNDAIEYVANSTRSEASQSFDKLVKVTGYAAAAVAAAMFLPRLLASM
ncbi:MAG: hypothetical protein AB2687_00490 [Candidatus Thiodiazotropha taylori]